MTSRRDKVLAFLAEQPGSSYDGSVGDLADDLHDPSPGALSATISVLVKDGVLGREPDGVGVKSTRLWLLTGAERAARPADTPAPAVTPAEPQPDPEVERCPHGVPAEAALTLCTPCKAAERQRKSRTTRRAEAAAEPTVLAVVRVLAPGEPGADGPMPGVIAEAGLVAWGSGDDRTEGMTAAGTHMAQLPGPGRWEALSDGTWREAPPLAGTPEPEPEPEPDRCPAACSEGHTYEGWCQLAPVAQELADLSGKPVEQAQRDLAEAARAHAEVPEAAREVAEAMAEHMPATEGEAIAALAEAARVEPSPQQLLDDLADRAAMPRVQLVDDDALLAAQRRLAEPSRGAPPQAVVPIGRMTAEVVVEFMDGAGCLSLRIDTPWPMDPADGDLVSGLMERVGAYLADQARREGR
jgi:hypothetical protein